MARTRATKAAPASKTAPSPVATKSKYSLSEESASPPQMFIVPKKATKEARIVSLPNPRYSKPTRYLVCPETGIYEFTKIAAPKTSPRSWLIETSPGEIQESDPTTTAQVTDNADLFVATSIDPLFLLLPALTGPVTAKSESTKRLFLSSDDHFDSLSTTSSHLSEIIRSDKTRQLLESRMEAVCDIVDAGDEKMYRLSDAKLVEALLSKAKAMSSPSLPSSMEDKFVKKALEAPILIQKKDTMNPEAKQATEAVANGSEVSTPQTESAESQSSVSTVDSTASFVSQGSTVATSVAEDDAQSTNIDNIVNSMEASGEVINLQRMRIAFNFICSSYVAPAMAAKLQELLANQTLSGVDFSPLDDYLARLTKLRTESAASRSMGDYSRKRVLDDEEEEAQVEKKRKMEEEKIKKANESRGVKNLKKVNTSGMKKLSEFFKKK